MENDAVTLQCPNEGCQTPNLLTDKFCQRCGTALSKRYLWAVGEGISTEIGKLVGDRYLQTSNRIFLDTKPGLLPEMPAFEIPQSLQLYLRLFAYRLQVPQVYGFIPKAGASATRILLLEQAPIYPNGVDEGQLMPKLTDAWSKATSMRQLNWLWQMANLWQPFSTQGVASSLLEVELLRVEASVVRVLELQPDQGSAPTLNQLGQFWSQLTAASSPKISQFMEHLCQSLSQGEINSSEQLINILDEKLAQVGRSQTRTITISTCTDTGPSRQRNEDACYPTSGTTVTKPPAAQAIAIVCDGIGGHEGGNVASNLAIETIQQQIEQMPLDDNYLDATTVITELEQATYAANERISDRNDSEQRSGRQRMGTTVVMTVANAHEIYVAHVGDSRAYWITRSGCYQVTLDDDVASREVRLGYALYRDALQSPASGSLVQALGMSASLHPTVQRFVLDEDCVFLLCSDGLSDYERVDQNWETEIVPILDGKVDVATACQQLVKIANSQNGHDNVTVGLIYCQINSSEPASTLSSSLDAVAIDSLDAPATDIEPANTLASINSDADTELISSPQRAQRWFVPSLVGLLCVLGLIGVYFYQQQRRPETNPNPVAPSSSPSPYGSPTPNQVVPSSSPSPYGPPTPKGN